MKKTITVTTTKMLEIDIPDRLLTPECVAEFSHMMWEVEGPDALFAHAARMIAAYDSCLVEGIGKASPVPGNGVDILWSELDYNVEVEFNDD